MTWRPLDKIGVGKRRKEGVYSALQVPWQLIIYSNLASDQ